MGDATVVKLILAILPGLPFTVLIVVLGVLGLLVDPWWCTMLCFKEKVHLQVWDLCSLSPVYDLMCHIWSCREQNLLQHTLHIFFLLSALLAVLLGEPVFGFFLLSLFSRTSLQRPLLRSSPDMVRGPLDLLALLIFWGFRSGLHLGQGLQGLGLSWPGQWLSGGPLGSQETVLLPQAPWGPGPYRGG